MEVCTTRADPPKPFFRVFINNSPTPAAISVYVVDLIVRDDKVATYHFYTEFGKPRTMAGPRELKEGE